MSQRNTDKRCSEPCYDKDRDRWRVIVRGTEGVAERPQFATKAAAQKFIDTFRAEVKRNDIDVEGAFDGYLSHLKEDLGRKDTHIATTNHRLGIFLKPFAQLKIKHLSPEKMNQLLTMYKEGHAVATRKSAVRQAKTWGSWLVEKGYLASNPASKLKIIETANAGKLQLRRTESQRLSAACIDAYNKGNEAGLMVLMALGLGLRVKEIRLRLVRDIDDDCRLLWVGKTKTRAGQRQLELPEYIAELLRKQIEGKTPMDYVFKYRSPHVICQWTKKFCKDIGAAIVTAQGLRGGFATLALVQGVAIQAVASTLGHAGTGVTRGHYAEPGSEQSGQVKQMETQLRANTRSQPDPQRQSVLN
jgi:integrase